jgi:hypothetical protein
VGQQTNWEEPIAKALAEGGLSLVSLAFAAFAFLYGGLLAIQGDDGRTKELKSKLRGVLYLTSVTVLLGSILTIAAVCSIGWGLRWLALVAMILAVVLVCAIPTVTIYLAWDVYSKG